MSETREAIGDGSRTPIIRDGILCDALLTEHALNFLRHSTLTAKERLVAWHLLQGLSNGEIARRVGNTDKCVKHHVAVIFVKTAADTRQEFFARVFPIGEEVPQELVDALPANARHFKRYQP